MTEITKRRLMAVKRTLEKCLDDLHGIHNDAYSMGDTETMCACHPAWEGVKNLLDALPSKIRKSTVKKVNRHLR